MVARALNPESWRGRKRLLATPLPTRWLPFVVLIIALGLTGLLTWLAAHTTRIEAQRNFDTAAEQVQAKIAARMESYIALLRGGAALASAFPYTVDETRAPAAAQLARQRFELYVERLRLPMFYPGVQGYGLSVRVQPAELRALFRRMHQEGYADFRVTPENPRAEYHVIVYLHPNDERNRAAIGYDMYTDPVRREAMRIARDTAQAGMSGPVTLVQEITPQKQAGFLIYVPVYASGAVPATVEERRALLQGFIYSPFRADDLLRGIVGAADLALLDLAVYDGPVGQDALLYESADGSDGARRARFTAERQVEIAGRTWTCVMNSRAPFEAQHDTDIVAAVMVGGILISVFLFYFTNRESHALGVAARTMRKLERSRGALSESERRFEDMANAVPVMLWEAETPGGRVYFNKSWLDFRGRTPAEERGFGWTEGIHPEDRDDFLARCKQAHEARMPYELEYRLRRHDGEYRWVVDNGVPRYNAVGFYAGYIGSCTDITNRKSMEEELEQRVRQRTAELEAANRELEAFSYSVSHDLRAPVRAINGFSSIVLKKQAHELSNESNRLIQKIHRNSIAMGQLIDDLLGFARVGRAPLNKRLVDVEDVVRQVVHELHAAEPERDVRVEIDPLPQVHADPSLLRQVFFNLLSNAFKFTRPRDVARIAVGATGDGAPTFYVRDNGVGFEPRFAHKMFAVFERMHSTEQFEGTGVGLALVQRIVERHGGRIWADAEPDRYAVFYFKLAAED